MIFEMITGARGITANYSYWDFSKYNLDYVEECVINSVSNNESSKFSLYGFLTKDDIVKVIHNNRDDKYIVDINLKNLEVNKSLSKKYNVYYKYSSLVLNRDPESWLDPYLYDLYKYMISNKILKNKHILIIIKDKHNKEYEKRYIFNYTYPYPYQPHFPIDISDEHLQLCNKLLDKLYNN